MGNASINKVILIGRLTDEPEPPRTLPNSGNQVVKFRFAVGRSRKNQSTGQWENDPNPLYIDCEAFSRGENVRLVDVIRNYLHKGSHIYLEGRLQLDSWDDKTSGQKRTKHKIVVEEIQMLDGRGEEGEGGAVRPPARPAASGMNRGGAAPSRTGAGFSDSRPSMDEPGHSAGSDEDIPF